MNVKQLYGWIEDQVADWGDDGVLWERLGRFGKVVLGRDFQISEFDAAVSNLIAAGRIRVDRRNVLTYRGKGR